MTGPRDTAFSWLAAGVGFYPPGMSAEALTAHFAEVLPEGLVVDAPRPRDSGAEGWTFRVTGLVDHEGQAVSALEMVPLDELAGLFAAEIFANIGALVGPVGEA